LIRTAAAIGVRFGVGEVAGCAGSHARGRRFGAECGDPVRPQQGVRRTAAAVACAEQVHGRL